MKKNLKQTTTSRIFNILLIFCLTASFYFPESAKHVCVDHHIHHSDHDKTDHHSHENAFEELTANHHHCHHCRTVEISTKSFINNKEQKKVKKNFTAKRLFKTSLEKEHFSRLLNIFQEDHSIVNKHQINIYSVVFLN